MDQKETQKINGINSQEDMWDDYIKEREEKEVKKESVKPQISNKVKDDLLEYQFLNSHKQKRNPLVLGLIIFIAMMVLGLSFYVVRSNTSYSEEVYYEDPMFEEVMEYEEYHENGMMDGSFYINGDTLQLPIKVYDFLGDNNFVIGNEAFDEAVTEVGEEPQRIVIKTDYGNKVADALVVSNGGTVPVEEATIIGLSTDQYGWVDYPDISLYGSDDDVEYILTQNGVNWTKSGQGNKVEYTARKEIDTGTDYKYNNVTITVNHDEISNITMILTKD